MTYLILFLIIILINVLPAFAPPTWTIIVFFLLTYNLNIFFVVPIAVVGASVGRYILYSYIYVASKVVFNQKEEENLKFLGDKIGGTAMHTFLFVMLYSLSPLSTTALFVASSIARVKKNVLIAGFFCGRSISYSVLAIAAKFAEKSYNDIFQGTFSLEAFLSALFGLLMVFSIIFIDWKSLLLHKKLRLDFNIWKSDILDRFRYQFALLGWKRRI